MTGAELRAIRLRLGLSQGMMAKLLGISRVHYNRLENGHRQITRRLDAHVHAIAPRTRRRI